jgi:hypothetical protein
MKEKKQITAPRALNLVMPSFKTRFYKESFKSRKEYDFFGLRHFELEMILKYPNGKVL